MRKLFTIAIAILFSSTLFAQTVVTGNVKDAKSGDPLPGVNIKVVGKSLGTATDFDGNYSLKVNQEPPFDVIVTTLGFGSQTLNVTEKNQTLDVTLTENASALDEVVVSASRTPESVRESPVTIERMDARDIANSASASFYNSIENLKGVDVNTSSLTFNSVNTRGFATIANTRFVQLIDGMDNASPALNFVMGNLVGMNELDVNSVELLPGASSALYGANAFNGILFMTSKNPFDHQGVSLYVKKGLTDSDAGGENAYTDMGIRVANAFSEKFAAKASFSYLKGTDWIANDTNQYDFVAAGEADAITASGTNPYAHNGVNIYGDEAATTLDWDAITGAPVGTFGSSLVGRQGYAEADLTDYEAKSVKTDISLNYRPFANDLEVIANYRIGFGNAIYQGTNRYQLKDFTMQQMKFEVRNDNFFLRAYRTIEDAGNTYDMNFTGLNMQRQFKSDADFFGDYATGYLGAVTGNAGVVPILTSLGLTPGVPSDAHIFGRILAENRLPNGDVFNPLDPRGARLIPGTSEFENAFNTVTSDSNILTGSLFKDNTSMNVGEGNYNFKSLLNDVIDLQVGGNYRGYDLNSSGTIFTDSAINGGAIQYQEYGAYVQAIKKFMDDRLKISASVRMDKNEFFDANISPRVSLNYGAGDNKQHNFRASFQTGFRNPDTQSLFIGFDVGPLLLVGSAEGNLDAVLPNTHLTARDTYNNSWTLSSFLAFRDSGFADPSLLETVVTDLVQPEEVTAIDVGYRGKLGKVSVDLNGYFNSYDGFISNTRVFTPGSGSVFDASGFTGLTTGRAFQLYTNSDADISSYGGSVGLSTRVGNGFKIGVNYTYAKLDFDQQSSPDFTSNFNTPEHKVKFSLGNANLFKNFGFNINGRWSDEFLWEATAANGIIEDRFVVDAQLNYRLPKWKSTFKLGGSNLTGEEYRGSIGGGNIGSQYFVSWVINN